MFVFLERDDLFLQSGTEITQLNGIHSEMAVRAHLPVRAQCCALTAMVGVSTRCGSARMKLPSRLQPPKAGTPACSCRHCGQGLTAALLDSATTPSSLA